MSTQVYLKTLVVLTNTCSATCRTRASYSKLRSFSFCFNDGFHYHWLTIKELLSLFNSYACSMFLKSIPPHHHRSRFFVILLPSLQTDLGRRERNAKKARTMMWKNALQKTWDEHTIEEAQKLFDRQPMIMESIIETEGGRTKF